MEIRKIVIVESAGQKKTVVETGAETLSQLKEALREKGIDYNGKTFFEGLSKTELTHDDSLLPRDIPRNGTTTNNLVFMLTTPQKKIKSGAMDRKEAYAKIKVLDLREECMRTYGKNFTMCKTADLISLIEKHMAEPKATVNVESEGYLVEETPERKAIRALVNALYENGCLDAEDADDVLVHIKDSLPENNSLSDSPYTDAEIDDIISDLL